MSVNKMESVNKIKIGQTDTGILKKLDVFTPETVKGIVSETIQQKKENMNISPNVNEIFEALPGAVNTIIYDIKEGCYEEEDLYSSDSRVTKENIESLKKSDKISETDEKNYDIVSNKIQNLNPTDTETIKEILNASEVTANILYNNNIK